MPVFVPTNRNPTSWRTQSCGTWILTSGQSLKMSKSASFLKKDLTNLPCSLLNANFFFSVTRILRILDRKGKSRLLGEVIPIVSFHRVLIWGFFPFLFEDIWVLYKGIRLQAMLKVILNSTLVCTFILPYPYCCFTGHQVYRDANENRFREYFGPNRVSNVSWHSDIVSKKNCSYLVCEKNNQVKLSRRTRNNRPVLHCFSFLYVLKKQQTKLFHRHRWVYNHRINPMSEETRFSLHKWRRTTGYRLHSRKSWRDFVRFIRLLSKPSIHANAVAQLDVNLLKLKYVRRFSLKSCNDQPLSFWKTSTPLFELCVFFFLLSLLWTNEVLIFWLAPCDGRKGSLRQSRIYKAYCRFQRWRI